MAFNLGNNLASLKIRIGADLTDFNKEIRKIEMGFEPIGKKLKSIGGAMSKFVALPTLAAGAASIKAAIDFESAFAGVRKTIDATEGEFAALRKGIVSMSKELPATAGDISGVAEAAGQLGIAKENVLSFSRTMIDLGETTNLSANEAATAFARFANITQMAQTDFGRLGSAVVDLGNNFATTEAEITQMALRLAGAGKQVGLSQADILGFAAALSSVGVESEAGGTAFSKLFAEIAKAVSKGGSKLTDFARIAGMSAGDYANAFRRDAAQATTAFVQGLGRISDSGGDVLQTLDKLEISEIRMRDAILRTAGAANLLNDAIEASNTAWEINNALVKEAEQRYGTAGAKLQIAKNQINAAAVETGSHLVPAFVDLAQAAGSAANAFSDLTPAMQKFSIASAGLTVAASGVAYAIGAIGVTSAAAVGSVAFLGAGFTALLATGLDINTFLLGYGARLAVAIKGTDDLAKSVDKIDFKKAMATANALSSATSLGFTINVGANLKPTPQQLQEWQEEVGDAARKLKEFVAQANQFKGLEMQGLDLSGFTETLSQVDAQTGRITERVQFANSGFSTLGMTLRETVAPAVGAVGSAMEDVSLQTLQANVAMAEFGAAMKANISNIGIRAVDGFSDAIGGAVAGFQSFGEAVKDVMQDVIAEITATIAKMLILKLVSVALGVPMGGSGGGGGGSFLGKLFGGFTSALGLGGGAGSAYANPGMAPDNFVMAAPSTFQRPPTSSMSSGGFGTMRIEVTGKLVGQGKELVAVVDQARFNQTRGF